MGDGDQGQAESVIQQFEAEMANSGFRLLPITIPHVRTAGLMKAAHRDPFDRLLLAQSQIEGLTLITADLKLQNLTSAILW